MPPLGDPGTDTTHERAMPKGEPRAWCERKSPLAQMHSKKVVVMTNLPIQKVLQKPDVAGRMVRWAVELSDFDIQYEPRGSIKGKVYADFVAELSPGGDPQEMELGSQWMLSVDGSSNQ